MNTDTLSPPELAHAAAAAAGSTLPAMDAFWMPFTANRQFKKAPRLLSKAAGMHFWTPEGRQILDGVAGLWCVNAGHGTLEDRACHSGTSG